VGGLDSVGGGRPERDASMTQRTSPGSNPHGRLAVRSAIGLVVVAAFLVGASGSIRAAGVPAGPVATTVDTVDMSALTQLSFSPDSFTVAPGELVDLVITQMADFNHTFTLSSSVNVTIPSSDSPADLYAYLSAHPPLVNVSLGSVVGEKYYRNVTAPAVTGTYEFLCEIHFPSMIGVMTVSSGSSPSSGSSGPSTAELAGVGAAVAGVAIVGVVLAIRRGRRTR
jgi:plastocyanin